MIDTAPMPPPLSIPPQPDVPSRPPEPAAAPSRIQVLVVDDEVRNLDVLEAVLASPDYRLVRATSPDEALLALIDGEFAAIVLDIQLPGMTGLELAHLIKQRRRTQDIPIIFLTAYFPEEKSVLAGYHVGAVDYLTKPINPQILRSKVAAFVDLHRKTQALAQMNEALAAEVSQRRDAEEALRQANAELESRVAQRTEDLTRANAHLRESSRALQESEGRFRLLADTSPVLIWMDGPDGCDFLNRAFVEFYGRPARDLLGYAWTKFIHPEDAAAHVAGYRATAEARQPFVGEARVRRADGQWRWLLSHVVPRFTADGVYLGRVGSSTDVTALKEIGADLQRARDEAVAASRAKDDFLAVLSHELRTPLNPVLMIASDAATNPDLPEAVREDFAAIRKNIEIEAGLIDDLLDLTRISRGKLVFRFRPLDVHRVVQEALAAVQGELDQKGLRVEVDLVATNSTVAGDAMRLQQVFWNVLRNAAKFTAAGGRIHVRTHNGERSIVVSVADTGIGMSPEELERIFDPFSQGDHTTQGISRRFGGLGLGLTIARRLVEHHDGFISAASPGRGQGATIAVTLPLVTVAPRDAGIEAGEASRVRGIVANGELDTSVVRSLRVLLVEDHAATRKTLQRLLTRRRHTVASAGTIAEALALAQAESFELLVSDIGLPDGDGCTLMQELRRAQPGIAGIALSGYGMEEDVARSRAAGFERHFVKPVDVRALDRAIALILARTG
jgi:PAS domain S-box-containing protein